MIAEHERTLHAIEARDIAAARDALVEHIDEGAYATAEPAP